MRGLGLGNMTILTYHSVNPRPDDKYSVSPDVLRRQLEFVLSRYPIVPLREIGQHFGSHRQRKVVLTFDDGFEDFLEYAYPVLRDLGTPTTLFVPTGFLGGWNVWDQERPEISRKKIMSAEALRDVCQDPLIDAGSHTMHHCSMKDLPVDQMYVQARGARQFLESLLDRPVTMFSYPYGHWTNFSDQTERVLIDTGHRIAVTSCWGTRNSARNMLRLRRIALSETDDLATVHRKIEGLYNWIGVKRHVGYTARTALRSAAGVFGLNRALNPGSVR